MIHTTGTNLKAYIINGVEKTITEENGNKFHLLCYFLNEEIKSNT